jgi:hypothetical protein
MFSPIDPKAQPACFDALDRAAIAYLCLPLFLFLGGWFEWWAALPLVACAAYALRPLIAPWPTDGGRFKVTWLQVGVAVAVGCAWAVLGGTDHLVFTNADWHIRDAVLHDLVASSWPVGYGMLDGRESLLRASIGFFLPAAVVGKVAGLSAAHFAILAWTAAGASLFLLQVLSLTRSRVSTALMAAAIVVFFSGLDIVGNLLNNGPRFRSDWDITTHLEWWAERYQYSSMTTQLFWVPNHALCGWLLIGLMYRDEHAARLDATLPMLSVAAALWSPLTAIGLIPFVLWKSGSGMLREHSTRLLRPGVWAPALAVGMVVAAYLALDPGGIPKGLALVRASSDGAWMKLVRHAQFFLLEAGLVGAAIFALRRSVPVGLALAILAVLPFAYLGPGNDLVMRASIPSLAVLTIAAALALLDETTDRHGLRNKAILAGLLIVGAMTPIAEIARAILLPAWPINTKATLIGASCDTYPPHYVARLGGEELGRILRRPSQLPLGPQGPEACFNPAVVLMWRGLGRPLRAGGERASNQPR